jgi:hypothetical protein
MVCNYINNTLFNLGHAYIVNDLNLWQVIDDIIELDECSVYSFNPDNDSDPNAEDGAMYVIVIFFSYRFLSCIIFFWKNFSDFLKKKKKKLKILHGPLYIQAHLTEFT